MTSFENELKYFGFLKEIVKRDIRRKYYQSVLGVLWTVLNPLLTMSVLSIVFSTIFRRNIENFPIYLLCGQLMFNFISGSGRNGLNAIIGNAGYIRIVYIPKYIFVLSRVIVAFVDLLFSLIALVIVMFFSGAPITWNLLALPVLFVLAFMFALGWAFIFATYGTFLRDLQHLYGVFSMLWMWLSAIFYPLSIVPVTYRFLFDLNPALHYITIMRAICQEGVMPDEKSLVIATCYSVLMLIMGISVFKSKENKFLLYI